VRRRAAWAAVLICLIGCLPYRAKIQVGGIGYFSLIEIAKRSVMNFSYRPVDKTPLEGDNLCSIGERLSAGKPLYIFEAFLDAVVLQIEAVKSGRWESYSHSQIIYSGIQTIRLRFLNIGDGFSIGPIGNRINFWEHSRIGGCRLMASIPEQDCCFDWRERSGRNDIRIGNAYPGPGVRSVSLLREAIGLNTGIGDSICRRDTLINLCGRTAQFLPLQIGRNGTPYSSEHDDDGGGGDYAIRSASFAQPTPSELAIAPSSYRVAPTNLQLWLGIFVCCAGALLCAACIITIVGGVQNAGLVLVSIGCGGGAVYLIAHGMFLASIGQWAAP
jgi:hypothetical protein